MARVSELMTSDVSTLAPEMTLREALEVLSEAKIGGAPVVSGSRVVGVVTAADLLEIEATTPPIPSFREEQGDWAEWTEEESWQEGASPPLYFVDLWREAETDAAERMSAVEGPEWDFLADHVVAEVMTRRLLVVSPDEDVRSAARRMTEAEVHRVLVIDDQRLVGVLSASDIVRAVADGVL